LASNFLTLTGSYDWLTLWIDVSTFSSPKPHFLICQKWDDKSLYPVGLFWRLLNVMYCSCPYTLSFCQIFSTYTEKSYLILLFSQIFLVPVVLNMNVRFKKFHLWYILMLHLMLWKLISNISQMGISSKSNEWLVCHVKQNPGISILCTHECKWEKNTFWNYFSNGVGRIKENGGGGELHVWYT
jgi:hypothetical protein